MNVSMIPATRLEFRYPAVEERIYLQPGTMYVTSGPASITTVLGSSVSVCLWSPAAAGMNHFNIPRGGADAPMRSGKRGLPILLDRMLELGAARDEIMAALFGGASLMKRRSESNLGEQNLFEAQEFLVRCGIPVMRHDTGGAEARKVTFRTIDGSTIVRRL